MNPDCESTRLTAARENPLDIDHGDELIQSLLMDSSKMHTNLTFLDRSINIDDTQSINRHTRIPGDIPLSVPHDIVFGSSQQNSASPAGYFFFQDLILIFFTILGEKFFYLKKV